MNRQAILTRIPARKCLHLIGQLNEEHGITIVIVTHDPGIARHAKRIIRLRDGVIVEDDAVVTGGAMR